MIYLGNKFILFLFYLHSPQTFTYVESLSRTTKEVYIQHKIYPRFPTITNHTKRNGIPFRVHRSGAGNSLSGHFSETLHNL
jgi:hypothetical protein